jgi:hypothetical protein
LAACADVFSSGKIREAVWRELTSETPEISAMRSEMAGPREGRVVLLEEFARFAHARRPSGNGTTSFLLAYLASSISPGTLEHVHLLGRHLPAFPDVLLWYGLCAGLWGRNTLIASGEGVPRRVVRELLREQRFLDAPTCDVALPELEVLSLSARDTLDIRSGVQGQLVVELLPGINATFPVPGGGDRPPSVPSPTVADLEASLNHLEAALKHANELVEGIRRRVSGTESRDPASRRIKRKPGQRDLEY